MQNNPRLRKPKTTAHARPAVVKMGMAACVIARMILVEPDARQQRQHTFEQTTYSVRKPMRRNAPR